MKSSHFLLWVLAGIIFHLNTYGQSASEYMTIEKRFTYTDVDGSPFLNEEWSTGYVLFKNGAKLNQASIRFNAYENKVEVKWQNEEYIASIENVIEFGYQDANTNKEITFKNVKTGNKSTLLQIISEGKNTFGFVNIIKRVRGSGSGLESVNNKDKLKLFRTPYMVKNNELVEFTNNKKSILSVLSDQVEKLEAYIKDNKLNVKKDDDLKRLLDYYNSL